MTIDLDDYQVMETAPTEGFQQLSISGTMRFTILSLVLLSFLKDPTQLVPTLVIIRMTLRESEKKNDEGKRALVRFGLKHQFGWLSSDENSSN